MLNWSEYEAVEAKEALTALSERPFIPLKFAIATPVEGIAKYISALLVLIARIPAGMITLSFESNISNPGYLVPKL